MGEINQVLKAVLLAGAAVGVWRLVGEFDWSWLF